MNEATLRSSLLSSCAEAKGVSINHNGKMSMQINERRPNRPNCLGLNGIHDAKTDIIIFTCPIDVKLFD